VAKNPSARKTKSAKAKKAAGTRKSKTAPAPATKAGKTTVRKTTVRKKPAGKTKADKAPAAAKRPARKVKSRLSKSQLNEFRQILLGKRHDLIGDMSGIEAEALHKSRQEGTGDLSNLPTHPADIGTDNYEQEFTLGLLESERLLLDEIDQALARIRNGTFGICLGTGKPIGKARLKARPWAKYCIEYAQMIEKGLVNPDEAGNAKDIDNDDAKE